MDDLRKLAEAAMAESDGDWFDPDLIDSIEKITATLAARRFMAAADPQTILALLDAEAGVPALSLREWAWVHNALVGDHSGANYEPSCHACTACEKVTAFLDAKEVAGG